MSAQPKIAPSILAADFARLGAEVAAMDKAGADYLHIDVMDGHFVPNLTIGSCVLSSIRSYTKKPLDVHLMIAPVDALLNSFIDAGADIVSFHPEATPDTAKTMAHIKDRGVKVGLVLNPDSPIDLIAPFAQEADLILQMSVQAGFGGQKFIESSPAKLAKLRQLINETGSQAELEIDGGITPATAKLAREAGADILVAGTSCFAGGEARYADNITQLRNA